MYTLKMSYGYVDEPEMATTEVLGNYETLDEAWEAAKSKFDAIMDDLAGECDICFGEVTGGCCDYSVTYGYYDGEIGRLFAGYDRYSYINAIER